MEPIFENKPKGHKTLKAEENVNTSEYVVKCALSEMITPSRYKNAILENINERVLTCSKAIDRLSICINIYVRDCLYKVKPIDMKIEPRFLSGGTEFTSFAYQLMLGEDGGKKSYPEIPQFLNRVNKFIPEPPKPKIKPDTLFKKCKNGKKTKNLRCNKCKNGHMCENDPRREHQSYTRQEGDTNTFVQAARQYLTNYKTFLKTTFYKYQKKFLYIWAENNFIPKDEIYLLQYMINNWKSPVLKSPPENHWSVEEKVTEMVNLHRKILQIEVNTNVNDIWIGKHYEEIIIYYHLISTYMGESEKKFIPLAPMSKIKRHFITIDTQTLHGIVKELDIVKCNISDFRESSQVHWQSLFYINKCFTNKNLTDKHSFTGTIQTDGTSICIHFRRPKPTICNPFEKRDSDRVIGLDPGRVCPGVAAEILNDGKIKTYKLSRQQYYTESGIFKARDNSNKWNLELKDCLETLSAYDTKTPNFREFMEFVWTRQTYYDELWSEYTRKRWSRQRLNLYSGKQRVFDNFLNGFLDKDDRDQKKRRIVIAYGDAKFASGGKGEISVPTSRLEKECKRRYHVVKIDEFRTTQIHYETNLKLASVYEKDEKYPVRGLLWCSSTNSSKFVNRDKNAALNMLRIYNDVIRHESLTRGTPVQTKPKSRIIKKTHRACIRGELCETGTFH